MKVTKTEKGWLMNHNENNVSGALLSEASEQRLTNGIANLAGEITPERDLWLGIERAISQKSQHLAEQKSQFKFKPTFVPTAWAASLVIAIFLSWLTFTSPVKQEIEQTVQQAPSTGLVTDPVATEQIVIFMQKNFQQQKEAMLVSFGQPNLTQLPAAMQQELQQLAAARKSIRQALVKNKNDVDLLNLLDFTQQQELKLIAQLYRQYQVI
jgi:hypothetical protein